MGKITGAAGNNFKSAEFIYSKIKREFKSFGSVNLLDDADFPTYTAEVLKVLHNIAYREEEAVLFVKNGKAKLPKDFKTLYAAYKCCLDNKSIVKGSKHLQNKSVVYRESDYEFLSSCDSNCSIQLCDEPEKLKKITVKTFVEEGELTYHYKNPQPLVLSPNARQHCVDDCINLLYSGPDEITINNGYMFTNFSGEDIYIQYYAFPYDADGNIMIPADNPHIEKAIEWYIKWQILLNYWLVDDVPNMQIKWGKAEQMYKDYLAEAKFEGRLPAFSTLINNLRNMRSINKVAFFSQSTRRPY